MSSNPSEATVTVEREEDGTNNVSSVINSDTPPLETSCPKDEEEQIDEFEDQSNEDAHKQLVVYYDPITNGTAEVEPISCHPPGLPRKSLPNQSSRVSPSVGAFTVQCASCFKWRLIPTKEKYEEIREHIIENPFYCVTAREWRPEISCEDSTDISPDGSRIWAIDKPSIAQPPSGWQRILRIRGEGGSKFADVYYATPTGKRLRSMVEVQRFMLEHPEYVEAGVKLSQFSFQVPRPLNENYVRKRPARLSSACDDGAQLCESSHGSQPFGTVGTRPRYESAVRYIVWFS
ncbi:methyl-CpG-binding domain-containing protein 2-like isoform X2 [Impatiens glandulifera]|uniref:methyl-CpG-binding domain-containing protein 2-like isoform X2 n=1 Tax=Impatiens glandulifera TaxID=253017 RepID=UPI001FB0C746|nr:methyl-CpG-binding domain-containing protein 2-like isoform X2 [Impatiens glandulifera]